MSNFTILSSESGQVVAVDRLTGSYIPILFGGPQFYDIATSPDGSSLIGLASDGELYQIDPNLGTSNPVNVNLGSGANALDIAGGYLFYTTNAGNIINALSLDGNNGSLSWDLGATNFRSSGDLEYDPLTNTLLATSSGNNGDALFVLNFNNSTLASYDIGFNNVHGLDLADGQVHGFTSDGNQIVLDPFFAAQNGSRAIGFLEQSVSSFTISSVSGATDWDDFSVSSPSWLTNPILPTSLWNL